MERQKKSVEVLDLLEKSTRQQALSTASTQKYSSSKSVTKSQGTSTVNSIGEISVRPFTVELQGIQASTGPTSGETKLLRTGSKRPKLSTVQPEKPLALMAVPLKVPLVEIKALPQEALPPSSPTLKKAGVSMTSSSKIPQHSKTGSSSATAPSMAAVNTSRGDSFGSEMLEELEMEEEYPSSLLDSEEESDDVVHCICGSTVDEGFMIQVG